MENRQKEFIKQSRKKMGFFNSYASPKFLANKISDSELPHAKKVEKEHDTFVSKNDKYTTSIPLTATGNIILKERMLKKNFKSGYKPKNYNLSISLPNQDTQTFMGKAKVAQDNSVIYKNYQESTDVIVQALNKSARILTVLNDADAPTEYKYKISIPPNGRAEKKKSGSIFIYNKDNKFAGEILAPWAIDKNGKKVPTHYRLEGDNLIQVVDHLDVNVEYPIISDPHFGGTYIDAFDWIWERKAGVLGWVLHVTPTYLGRFTPEKILTSQFARAELVNSGWLDLNRYGMEMQYICHHVYAWWRPGAYHLEEWRPPANYFETVAAKCNPT